MRFVANRRATDMTGWRRTERTRSTRPRSMPSEEARGAQRNKSTPKCVRLGARGAGDRFLSPALHGSTGRPRKTMACPTTAAFKYTQLAHLFHDKPSARANREQCLSVFHRPPVLHQLRDDRAGDLGFDFLPHV